MERYTWIHLNERILLGRSNWAALVSPPVSSFIAIRTYKSRSEALVKFSTLFWKLKLVETQKLGIAGRKYLEVVDCGSKI